MPFSISITLGQRNTSLIKLVLCYEDLNCIVSYVTNIVQNYDVCAFFRTQKIIRLHSAMYFSTFLTVSAISNVITVNLIMKILIENLIKVCSCHKILRYIVLALSENGLVYSTKYLLGTTFCGCFNQIFW